MNMRVYLVYHMLYWCRHITKMASDVSGSVIIRQLAALSHWRIWISYLSTMSRWLPSNFHSNSSVSCCVVYI